MSILIAWLNLLFIPSFIHLNLQVALEQLHDHVRLKGSSKKTKAAPFKF
jgi:hypothetical protein